MEARLEKAFREADISRFILVARAQLETISKKLSLFYPNEEGKLALNGDLQIAGFLKQVSNYNE